MKNNKISRKNIDRIHWVLFIIIVVLFANHEANRLHQQQPDLAKNIHDTEKTISVSTFFPMQANR